MTGTFPKYIQIYNQLKNDIIMRKYPPNSFLPTETELVELYSVSRNTIRHAMKLLQEQEFVTIQQGCGTRVNSNSTVQFSLSKYHNASQIRTRFLSPGPHSTQDTFPAIDIVPAPEHIADKLDVVPGVPIYRIQRLKLVDDQVFGYKINYLNCMAFPNLESHTEHIADFYALLKREYGTEFTFADESISAMAAKFQEAHFLNVAIGTPLLVLKRSAFCKTGILEYCETILRPDLYDIVVTLSSEAEAGKDSLL